MAKITSSLTTGISIHNNLQGLNDPEYIHLTTLEKTKLDGIEDGAQVNPTNTSELINDGAYGLSTYVETDELGAVAFSNNYNDLDNLPVIPSSYTDEQAQDAVGNILTDSSTIDLSYDDLTNEISAEIIPGSITSNELANNINISEFINDENYTDEDYVDEKIVQTITDGDTTHTSSSDALFDALALKQNSLGYTPENISNKQNSLLVDGTGLKYPTVDAINSALSSLSIPDASETVSGKVNILTQTFGGNKKIVGESSTVGNAFEVQNLAHRKLFELGNGGVPVVTLNNGLSDTDGFTLKNASNSTIGLVVSVGNTQSQLYSAGAIFLKSAVVLVNGSFRANDLSTNANGRKIMVNSEIGGGALAVSTFGLTTANNIGAVTLLGQSKTFQSPLVYTTEANNGAAYTGLIGSYHNQIIRAQANSSVLIGMLVNPNYQDNSKTGLTKIAFGIEATAGFGLYQKGSLVNYLEGNLAIGNTTPDASAKVQIESTTQGFSPPRMTTTQKNAIVTPMAGLMVFDTTLMKLCVFTTVWETITSI